MNDCLDMKRTDRLSLQDLESPDVYETHSPSPTRRSRNLNRSNRVDTSQSSEEDSDEDGIEDSDMGAKSGRRGTKKVGGQKGAEGINNPDIVASALNPEEASKRFQKASGVDSRRVGEWHTIGSSRCIPLVSNC